MKDILKGGVVAGIIILIGFMGFWILVGIGFPNLILIMAMNSFDQVSESWQDSNFVESVVHICSLKKQEIEMVDCVSRLVSEDFEYKNHGTYGNSLRIFPEDIKRSGGVCRDWATLYKSIFDKMGIENEFKILVTEEGSHIYNKVYLKDYVCLVDQEVRQCYKR